MIRIRIANVNGNIAELIDLKDKLQIEKPNAIIIQNMPKVNKKDIKRILRNHKEKYLLQHKPSANYNTTVLVSKKNKLEGTRYENSFKLNNMTLNTIEIKKIHTIDDIRRIINEASNTQNDNHDTVIIGYVYAINEAWTDINSLKTLIEIPSLNSETINLNEYETQYKRGKIIANIMRYKGFINIAGNKKINSLNSEQLILYIKKGHDKSVYTIEQNDTKQALITRKWEIAIRDSQQNNETRYTLNISGLSQRQFIDHLIASKKLTNSIWMNQETTVIERKLNKLANLLYYTLDTIQVQCTKERKKHHNKRYHELVNRKYAKLIRLTHQSETAARKQSIKARLNLKEKRKFKQLVAKAKQLKQQLIIKSNIHDYENTTLSEIDDMWKRIKSTEVFLKGIKSTNKSALGIKSKEALDTLMEKKFPTKTRTMGTIIDNLTREQTKGKSALLTINQHEIERAIYELRKKTYTGVEGINFKIFLESIKYIKETIYTICQMSFHIGKTPENCQTTLGNLIPKKAINQFRIVHVSTPLNSLIEQIALHRLEYRLEVNRQLNPRQYGFTALRDRHQLISRIISMAKEREIKESCGTLTLVSLDIEGAFDNVDQDVIITRLLEKLKPDNISTWIANFILNRHIITRYNGMQSEKRQIYTGVPQGSALGPILWNFTINEIDLNIRKHNRLEILAYADDLLLVHKTTGNETYTTQKALDMLIAELNKLKLNIRPEKCSTMHIEFHRHEGTLCEKNELCKEVKESIKTTLKIGTDAITTNDKINILGVKLTNKLKLDIWNSESIDKITTAANKIREYRQLRTIKNTKEWRILIDSYLISRIIINNLPILAVDYEAVEWCNKLTFDCYCAIFNWKDERTFKVLEFLTEAKNTFNIIKGSLSIKSTFKHNAEFRRMMKAITKCIEVINNERSREDEDENWNEPDLVELVDRDNDDDNFYVSEIDEGYTLPRYYNPNKDIPNIIEIDNVNELTGEVTYWTINCTQNGCQLHLHNIEGSIRQSKLVTQTQYTIDYFNEMAAIWHISDITQIDDDRQILLANNDSLLQALKNMSNRDWRIIKLRERLTEWNLIIIDRMKLNNHIKHIEKGVKEGRINILESTTTVNSREPDVSDYLLKYIQKQKHKIRIQETHERTCPDLLKQFNHLIDIKCWKEINYAEYSKDNLLALSAYYRNEPNDNGWKSDINDGRASDWPGCRCKRNNNSTTLYTTQHRALECQRFAERRKRFEELANEITNLRILNKNTEQSFINKELELELKVRNTKALLSYLTDCANYKNQ